MFKPYSRRNTPKTDVLAYEIGPKVRKRILFAIEDSMYANMGAYDGRQWVHNVLMGAGWSALRHYGEWEARDEELSVSNAQTHFLRCSDEKCLDFIEFLFHGEHPYKVAHLVGAINAIFQDESIGYELSPMREEFVEEDDEEKPGGSSLTLPPGGRRIEIKYPYIIRKDTEYLHSEVVRPCLEALTTPGFHIAYSEMMKAHEAYRRSHYADAITDAGSAFESVMKTICTHKKWPYDKNKDTCSALVRACKDNNLFPSFYAPIFESVGTLRNKLSDAHGRGPKALVEAEKSHADHMIQTTSSHITFLIKVSGL